MSLVNDLHLAAVEFDYSILEAIYPAELNRTLLEFIHEEIDPEDVIKSDEIKGKEDTPHITILYGIKEIRPDIGKVSQVIQNHPSLSRVGWLGLGKFESEEYDVLIIQIESDEAEALFRDFQNIYPDNANSFPDYKPHTTLAYMKKGEADKYIEKFNEAFVDDAVTIKYIRFDHNGEHTDFEPTTGEVLPE